MTNFPERGTPRGLKPSETAIECTCMCHSHSGAKHMMPCCNNGWIELPPSTKEKPFSERVYEMPRASEEYFAEWDKIIKKLEDYFDLKVSSFDPSIQVYDKKSVVNGVIRGQFTTIPIWLAERMIESYEAAKSSST